MGIRQAESADLETVEAIVRAAYEPWIAKIGMRPRPLAADYGALIAGEHVHVLENGEVDAVIVLETEDTSLLIENVAVRPDRQGRGLGRRLMAFAEYRARNLRLAEVRLYTNAKMAANISLYESLGYRETGREAVNGGNIVHMRKVL